MANRSVFTSLIRFFLSRPYAFLAGCALVSVLPIILLGTPGGDDFYFHQQTWLEVATQHQLLPRWTQGGNFGFGDARLIFYPPLSWLLGGNLYRIFPMRAVPGIFVFICALIASLGMYWLARIFFLRNKSIIVGAVYALSPYFLFDIYHRSAYAECLALAILPVSVCCLLQLRRHRRFRDVALFSFSLALIWLANIPLALIASLTVAVLTCVQFAISRDARFLARATAGVLIAVALTAFYWIPVIVERTWNNPARLEAQVTSVYDFIPQLAYADNPDIPIRGIPISYFQAVLALFLVVWLYRRRRTAGNLRWMLTTLAILSAVMMLPVSLPIWKLPVLRYMEIPFRWLAVWGIPYSFAMAFAFSRWRRTICTAATLGVLAILCLPAFIHPTGFIPRWLDDTRRSLLNGEGYENGVSDWDPREFNLNITARDLPLASFVPGGANASSAACGPNNIHVALWSPEHRIVDAECSADSVLRFHLAYFPLWTVVANGKPIKTFYDRAGVLEAAFPAGRNHIDISLSRPAFETSGDLLSLFALVCCISVNIIEGRRRPTRDQG